MRIYYNEQCIYFTKSANVVIRAEGIKNAWLVRDVAKATLGKIFHRFIASQFDNLVLEGDVDELYNSFEPNFCTLPAAGGVVWNEKEELLMIHRLGKWDLPKGKLDPGEQMAMCAVREVEEETGLDEISFSGFLKSTYHIYQLKEDWILKKTEWYELHAPKQPLVAEAEEDIAQAIWVPQKDIKKLLENSYPNIVFLLQDLLGS